jgi:hypothetical protein
MENFTLGKGPSREKFFDCLRLGQISRELKSVDFSVITSTADSPTKIWTIYHVEIEGAHQASSNGSDWFFWGKTLPMSASRFTPAHKGYFVFGRWDFREHVGQMTFGETSFFESLL